ncbi:class I SAM-dependent methyltransferase [Candidatus Woesearchaeota archaeon]|nr:class I SAM-dependent methyltransferase [Candidatus Woesearchaeota archaeon]
MQHYFSPRPDSALREKVISVSLLGRPLSFSTPSGTFSFGKADAGSRLLAEHALAQDGWDILDYGCGWGLVGIALGKANPGAKVCFVDINRRALEFTSKNAQKNNLKNISFIGDKIPEGMKFDTILLNPPQHAGKDACYAMFREAKEHLKPNGIFQIVARHNKGGKSFSEKMKGLFGNVMEIAKKSGYRVYVSKNG